MSVCQMLTLSRYLTQNCSPNKYTFHLKLKFKQTKQILQFVGVFVLEILLGRTVNLLFRECLPTFLGFTLIGRRKKKKIKIFSTIVKILVPERVN